MVMKRTNAVAEALKKTAVRAEKAAGLAFKKSAKATELATKAVAVALKKSKKAAMARAMSEEKLKKPMKAMRAMRAVQEAVRPIGLTW